MPRCQYTDYPASIARHCLLLKLKCTIGYIGLDFLNTMDREPNDNRRVRQLLHRSRRDSRGYRLLKAVLILLISYLL